MVEIRQRHTGAAAPASVHARLELPFEDRQKTRLRTRLDDGEEAWVLLPRGQVLRGGDLLVAEDGRVIRVVARPERVMHVTCATPAALAKAAYHLGNRHVPVEVGEGYLRLAEDHVLKKMLLGLDAEVRSLEAPFEPEAGAYGAGHSHGSERGHGGYIHEYPGGAKAGR